MITKTIKSMITTVINPFDGLISRYFVNLDPVLNSYYELASPITFTGDFEIETEFSTTSADNQLLVGDNFNTTYYFRTDASSGFKFFIAGANISFSSSTNIKDGELHKVKFKLVGTSLSCILNNISLGSQTITPYTGANNFIIGNSNVANFFFDGIIANAKFTDKSGASDVVTTFKLDQATANTESSIEGNNSVTYTNIPQSARELYSLEDDTWTTGELLTNGDFATDSDWAKVPFFTISGGKANCNYPQGNVSLYYQGTALEVGKTYITRFDVSNYVTGAMYLRVSSDNYGVGRVANGTYTETLTAITNTELLFTGISCDASIDNVSVKEVIEVAS